MRFILFIAVLILVQHLSDAEEPFCKKIDIDDAMRFKGILLLFQGDHFWEIPDRKIPLTTPKQANAKKIKDQFPGITDGSIDAISELGDQTSEEFVWIKGSKIHFMKDPKTEEKVMELKELLGGNVPEGAQTLWYNKNSKHLFIFTGYKYNEFEKMDGSWNMIEPKDRKVVVDFKINVHIESAFSHGDYGYLISGNWFFKVPMVRFKWPGTAYGGQLVFGWKRDPEPLGLFNTKEDCNMADDAYYNLAYDQDLKHGLEDPNEIGVDATYEAVPGDPPPPGFVAQEDEPDLRGPPGKETPGGGQPGAGAGGKGKPSLVPGKPGSPGTVDGTGNGKGNEPGATSKPKESKSEGIPTYVWYIVAGVGVVVVVVVVACVFFLMRKKSRR